MVWRVVQQQHLGQYPLAAWGNWWAMPAAHHRSPETVPESSDSSMEDCWVMAIEWRRSHHALVRWGGGIWGHIYVILVCSCMVYWTRPLTHCWRTEAISTNCSQLFYHHSNYVSYVTMCNLCLQLHIQIPKQTSISHYYCKSDWLAIAYN